MQDSAIPNSAFHLPLWRIFIKLFRSAVLWLGGTGGTNNSSKANSPKICCNPQPRGAQFRGDLGGRARLPGNEARSHLRAQPSPAAALLMRPVEKHQACSAQLGAPCCGVPQLHSDWHSEIVSLRLQLRIAEGFSASPPVRPEDFPGLVRPDHVSRGSLRASVAE